MANKQPAEENWAFAGTRLLTGEALVRLIFTGGETLYGGIVQAATATGKERTPLQDDVGRLVRGLVLIAMVTCLLLAAVRLYQGHGLVDAFLSAAVLAVAAIPEEFPVVLTFFLGVGVYRLARQKALVRRAVAVENIGRISAICSDKTGTITQGRLQIHDLRPANDLRRERLLQLAAMASRADSHDPLDQALLAGAPSLSQSLHLLESYPFTEGRRRETAIWRDAGALLAVAKGAPETILALCELDEAERATYEADLADCSATGQKVIACAYRTVTAISEPAGDFVFAGFIGIADPLREGVRQAVEEAIAGGIQVLMVTGDHPQTARAIAREAGLSATPIVVSGNEMQARLKAGERQFLKHLHVVARATPAQKQLLVEAMRENGGITAVTGDGVNDVPALKAADIGIAMGLRGTQSAREVAAIVLMDDNFGTIVRAIAEGRQLFCNLKRSFAFLLMVHIPLVTTAALIPLLGYPLLYLPIHIVLLELLIHPSAILGFQQAASTGIAARGQTDSGFFNRREIALVLFTGLFITAAISGLFIAASTGGEPSEQVRTMSVVALVIALLTLLAALTRLRGRAAQTILAMALAFTFLVTSVPILGHLFGLQPLSLSDGAISALAGFLAATPALFFPFTGSAEPGKAADHAERG